MGFYGNITNTSRTTFSFDKTYNNRYEMDFNSTKDGVYAGRYVLVNYETDSSVDIYNSPFYCCQQDVDVDGNTLQFFPTIRFLKYASPNQPDSDDEDIEEKNTSIGTNAELYLDNGSSPNNLSAYEHFYYDFSYEHMPPEVTEHDLAIEGRVFKIDIGHHVYDMNAGAYFIAIDLSEYNGDLTNVDLNELDPSKFTIIDHDEWYSYWYDLIIEENKYTYDDVNLYDINGYKFLANPKILEDAPNSERLLVCIPRGGKYYTNFTPELWAASISKNGFNETTIKYERLSIENSNYVNNFEIDRKIYRVSRGYDSTVWQKVFADGRESYVMIAELNTVVPTFDVSPDAPSLSPIQPHFDTNSTNVYYKLHWQPNWGLRIKGAETSYQTYGFDWHGPIAMGSAAMRNLEEDAINYPSDQYTTWTHKVYNQAKDTFTTQYYMPKYHSWTTEENKDTLVPAAIYMNKAGFSPNHIVKSADVITAGKESYNADIKKSGWTNENKIELTPTGRSGNVYNPHSYEVSPTIQDDTQELSIMLPGLGDTISEIWDLIYGGRDTNEAIKTTNRRNTNIDWEQGKAVLGREGLRLVSDTNTGKYYNPKEVETIAGCLNSVHDIMGMNIIELPIQTNDDGSQSTIIDEDMKLYDENRIYYDPLTTQFYRKKRIYDYDREVETYFEQVNDLTDSHFNVHLFYIKVNDEYIPASSYNKMETYYKKDGDAFTPLSADQAQQELILHLDHCYVKCEDDYLPATAFNKNYEYYAKVLYNKKDIEQSLYTPEEEEFTDFYAEGVKYWYQDYNSTPDVTNPLKMDYISEKKFYPDKEYYSEVTASSNFTLVDSYEKNKFFYQRPDGSFYLDRNDKPYQPQDDNYIPTKYYTVDPDKIVKIERTSSNLGYNGIYIPNMYYYNIPVFNADGNPELDEYSNIKFNYILDNSPTLTPQYPKIYPDCPSEAAQNAYTLWCASLAGLDTFQHYRLNPTIAGSDDKSYILVTSYVPITIESAKDYVPGTFYIEYPVGSSQFLPDYNDYNSKQNYYKRVETYKLFTGRITLENLTVVKLINFSENTFYRPIVKREFDPDTGEIMEFVESYQVQTVRSLTDDLLEWMKQDINIDDDSILNLLSYVSFLAEKDEDDPRVIHKFLPIDFANPDCAIQYQVTFYEPYTYHYQVESGPKAGSYVLDTNSHMTADRNYFELLAVKKAENIKFFEEYKYYEFNEISKEFELSHDTIPVPGKTYFKKNGIYIKEDAANVYSPGAEWNINAQYIPPTVDLRYRDEHYELVPIPDFARNLNTMHGLLLKINYILEFEDKYTRERSEVQGALNKLSDIIASFGKMTSDQILIVDDYGRVHSSESSTNQASSLLTKKPKAFNGESNEATNYRYTKGVSADFYPEAKSLDDMEKQWITLNVDGNVESPSIQIHHNFQPVTSTSTISNKNSPVDRLAAENTAKSYDNNTTDDTLKLYTPIVDAMGHIVGKNQETVTLPYGFKTFSITNATIEAPQNRSAWNQKDTSVLTSSAGDTTDVIADNTQDTLTLQGGNGWIRLETNNLTDTIVLSHETHTVNEDIRSLTDLNVEYANRAQVSDNLTFQDMEFDKAGHIYGNHKHEYKLPNSFKFISTNGAGDATEDMQINQTPIIISADNTQDELKINSDNQWIRIKTEDSDSENILTFAHEIHEIDDKPATNTNLNLDAKDTNDIKDNVDTITIQDITKDGAGHITAIKPHKYILPYGFKTIKANNNINVFADAATTIKAEGQSADSTQDTLTFEASNDWIRVDNNTEDTLKLGHKVNDITVRVSESVADAADNLNLETNATAENNLNIPDWDYDKAGHITEKINHYYTLPYSFKTIAIDAPSEATNNPAASRNSVVADTTQDTLTIGPGNKWIQINSDTENDKIIISHTVSTIGSTSVQNITNNKFGGTITIPDLEKDASGHITKIGSHTVNIPQGSLSSSEASSEIASLVTSVDLTSDSGAITVHTNKLGSMQLGANCQFDTTNASDLTQNTTLSDALKSLDERIYKEETTRQSIPIVTVTADTISSGDNSITPITDNTTFLYAQAINGIPKIDPITQEPIAGQWEIEPQPQVMMTIANLVNKIKELEDRIQALEH